MFRSILLPVDGSPYTEWARRAAAQLLAPQGRLSFLYVVDIVALEGTFLQDLAGAVGAEPFLNLSPKLERVLREKGNALLDTQKSACSNEQLNCETSLETGVVADVIAKKAVGAEVVVIGRHGHHAKFREGLAGSTTESVIRRSPRPVLVISGESKPIQRVLLGFDGSRPAAHALSEAARFCREKGAELTVLVVGTDTPAKNAQEEANRFLAGAGVKYAVKSAEGDAPEVLVREAAGYDLLIVGAFGHSRIVELVVGSTTEYVLRNATVPTLFIR